MSGQEQVRAIQAMLDMPGWQLVEAYIQRRIQASRNQLMICPLEKVSEHRAAAAALNGVLLYVEETLKTASEEEQ